jgi:predicted ABC-type sugar transport system permease subunit
MGIISPLSVVSFHQTFYIWSSRKVPLHKNLAQQLSSQLLLRETIKFLIISLGLQLSLAAISSFALVATAHG